MVLKESPNSLIPIEYPTDIVSRQLRTAVDGPFLGLQLGELSGNTKSATAGFPVRTPDAEGDRCVETRCRGRVKIESDRAFFPLGVFDYPNASSWLGVERRR